MVFGHDAANLYACVELRLCSPLSAHANLCFRSISGAPVLGNVPARVVHDHVHSTGPPGVQDHRQVKAHAIDADVLAALNAADNARCSVVHRLAPNELADPGDALRTAFVGGKVLRVCVGQHHFLRTNSTSWSSSTVSQSHSGETAVCMPVDRTCTATPVPHRSALRALVNPRSPQRAASNNPNSKLHGVKPPIPSPNRRKHGNARATQRTRDVSGSASPGRVCGWRLDVHDDTRLAHHHTRQQRSCNQQGRQGGGIEAAADVGGAHVWQKFECACSGTVYNNVWRLAPQCLCNRQVMCHQSAVSGRMGGEPTSESIDLGAVASVSHEKVGCARMALVDVIAHLLQLALGASNYNHCLGSTGDASQHRSTYHTQPITVINSLQHCGCRLPFAVPVCHVLRQRCSNALQ